jgi:hypothetical protein
MWKDEQKTQTNKKQNKQTDRQRNKQTHKKFQVQEE